MCVVKDEKQMITFPVFLEFALHEKQPAETFTGFKLTYLYPRCMAFLKCACVIRHNKESPCVYVWVCGREISFDFSMKRHSASVPCEAY